MSAVPAADRLADGYPHGTPAGYRDGCRSNGGCLNRGTTLMTCVEANQRYAHDIHYRRAYDSGDIILNREKPLDEEAETKRTALARRTVPNLRARDGQGWAHQPDEQLTVDHTPRPTHKPAAAPTTSPEEAPPTAPSGEVTGPSFIAALEAAVATADAAARTRHEEAAKPKPRGRRNAWRHGTPYGYSTKGCTCDACTAAYHEKNRARRPGTEATYKGKWEQAQAEISRLTAELATARSNLAELAAMKPPRPVEAEAQTPVITFDLLGDRMVLTIAAEIGAHDVEQLGDYLTVRTAATS